MPCETWPKKTSLGQVSQYDRAFLQPTQQFRGIATGYDKDPRNFLAAIKLAATRIWIGPLWVMP
jgi:transposase